MTTCSKNQNKLNNHFSKNFNIYYLAGFFKYCNSDSYCTNYNDYFCENGNVMQCINNGRYWEKQKNDTCSGKLEQNKRIKIIIPSNFDSEQRAALDKLKQTLKQKFNPNFEEISSSSVACNQVEWFDSLKETTLIIIGTTKSNPSTLTHKL